MTSEQVRLSAKPPPEQCSAVVLQLDICGFTVLSQVRAREEARGAPGDRVCGGGAWGALSTACLRALHACLSRNVLSPC